ncbi:MAG: phosphonate ABC transporter, permease protein PhnE, partial [Microbacterium sp.]
MTSQPRPLVVPKKPTSRVRTSLVALAFAAFTIATCIPAIGGIDLDIGALIRNWSNGSGLLAQFLQPDFGFLPRTIGPMLETLQMAVVGAALAAVISVPLTLWAASPTNPNTPTRIVVRTIINVIRSVPDLVYA